MPTKFVTRLKGDWRRVRSDRVIEQIVACISLRNIDVLIDITTHQMIAGSNDRES